MPYDFLSRTFFDPDRARDGEAAFRLAGGPAFRAFSRARLPLAVSWGRDRAAALLETARTAGRNGQNPLPARQRPCRTTS